MLTTTEPSMSFHLSAIEELNILWEIPECDRDMKWANPVGKVVPIDLLDARLPQTFNLWEKKKPLSVKHNKAKCNKTWYDCLCIYISTVLLLSLENPNTHGLNKISIAMLLTVWSAGPSVNPSWELVKDLPSQATHQIYSARNCISGVKPKREGMPVNIQLIHFVVRQKLTQHCKAIILQ